MTAVNDIELRNEIESIAPRYWKKVLSCLNPQAQHSDTLLDFLISSAREALDQLSAGKAIRFIQAVDHCELLSHNNANLARCKILASVSKIMGISSILVNSSSSNTLETGNKVGAGWVTAEAGERSAGEEARINWLQLSRNTLKRSCILGVRLEPAQMLECLSSLKSVEKSVLQKKLNTGNRPLNVADVICKYNEAYWCDQMGLYGVTLQYTHDGDLSRDLINGLKKGEQSLVIDLVLDHNKYSTLRKEVHARLGQVRRLAIRLPHAPFWYICPDSGNRKETVLDRNTLRSIDPKRGDPAICAFEAKELIAALGAGILLPTAILGHVIMCQNYNAAIYGGAAQNMKMELLRECIKSVYGVALKGRDLWFPELPVSMSEFISRCKSQENVRNICASYKMGDLVTDKEFLGYLLR